MGKTGATTAVLGGLPTRLFGTGRNVVDSSYATVEATDDALRALDLALGFVATGASMASSSEARFSGRPRGLEAGRDGGSSPPEFQGTLDGVLRAFGLLLPRGVLLRPRRRRDVEDGSGVPMS